MTAFFKNIPQFEDFKYVVSLPTPHPYAINEIMGWLQDNKIRYLYTTFNVGGPDSSVEYHFAEEQHAMWFRLRFL